MRIVKSLSIAIVATGLTFVPIQPVISITAVEASPYVRECATLSKGPNYTTVLYWTDGATSTYNNLRVKSKPIKGTYVYLRGAKGVRKPRVVNCTASGTNIKFFTEGKGKVWIAQSIAGMVPVTDNDQTPLPIYGIWKVPISMYAPVEDGWQVANAVAVWNTALPLDRQITLQSTPCNEVSTCIPISTVTEVIGHPEYGGAAPIQPDGMGGIISCSIILDIDLHPDVRPAAMAHEIGHCLGLNHWNNHTSIMHPIAGAAGIPAASTGDLDYLRTVYQH